MANNWGWRYVMFTSGSLVLAMSLLRVTVVRLRETPKYLLSARQDARLVADLQALAQQYGRPCSLTIEKLEACGPIRAASGAGASTGFFLSNTWIHLSGLFATRRMAISTVMIWFSWTLIGLAYPLFYVFLKYALPTPQHPSTFPFCYKISIHQPITGLLTGSTQHIPCESWRTHGCGHV